MYSYSVWSHDSPHRQLERVNEALRDQHDKNMIKSTRFIPVDPPKEPLLFTPIAPKREDIFTSTASRQTAERRVKPATKPGFWQRLGRLFL